jgi:hypothetical protein
MSPDLACPTWCATDHATVDRFCDDRREHTRAVDRVTTDWAPAHVEVCLTDNLSSGLTGPASVLVECASTMDPEEAHRLAGAIIAAAKLARDTPLGGTL